MMDLQNSSKIKSEFELNGYVLIKPICSSDAIKRLTESVHQAAREVLGSREMAADSNVLIKLTANRTLWDQWYVSLQKSRALRELTEDPLLLSRVKGLGIVNPVLTCPATFRASMPHQNDHLLAPHQDDAYSGGTSNAMTVWITFTPGKLKVYPASHHLGRLEHVTDNHNRLSLLNAPARAGIELSLAPFEAVVFSKYLIHESVENRSEQVRYCAQIRYSDQL